MMDKVLLAGFGGQGVMFIGKVLTYAGMLDGLEVCWIPSYGPEMRGGTANCSVILSQEEIHSPVIAQADRGIVLNQPSYEKFLPRIKPGGTLVVNRSIVSLDKTRGDINIIAVPGGDMAHSLGNARLANMVCLGAMLPGMTLLGLAGVEKALDEVVGHKRPELYDVNLAAVRSGLDFCAKQAR